MSSRQVSTALITIPLALCVVFLGFGVLTLPRLSEGGTYALVVFLIFPTVAAAVLVVLLRLHHPLRDKIVISLTATLLTLYAIEMGITWLDPDTVDEFQGSRVHIQEVDRLRGEGLKATLNVTPKGLVGNRKPKIGSDEVLPLGGVANSVIVLCNEIGKWITYESDENGFANPPGLY